MDLQLLEHRVRVTSIDKAGLWFYTHSLVKLLFLRHRTAHQFFSLTETPEDYTLMLDEAGFEELPPSDFLHVADATWRVLNVLSNGCLSAGVQTVGVTKIAKSVIAPLAEHDVSVLMLSTYQTDFILTSVGFPADECGIVAQIAEPLAAADISAYYISTFNFDHALVPEEDITSVISLLHQRQESGS
ncbi:hypothetical protein FKM82_020678 [Ascaphus truei]